MRPCNIYSSKRTQITGLTRNGGLKECGEPTWSFYRLPEVRQKPLDPGLADRGGCFLGRGAHMPLCVFIQQNENVQRGKDQWQTRSVKIGEYFVGQNYKAPEAQGNLKGRRGPRVGNTSGKGTSAVAGAHASSSSGCQKGNRRKTRTKVYFQGHYGDMWHSTNQAQPSGSSGDPATRTYYDTRAHETNLHRRYDGGNPEHRNIKKANADGMFKPAPGLGPPCGY